MGYLGIDSLNVGDLMVNNASIGLVTQASVNLTGASCDGIFVRDPLHTFLLDFGTACLVCAMAY